MTITAGQVKTIIKNNLEQEQIDIDAANELADWADAHAGKLLTERNKPEGWHTHKTAGMTYLETDAYFYDRTDVKKGGPKVSILIEWANVGVRVNDKGADYLREHSPAFYAAAEQRNERRRELLADPTRMRSIARALHNVHKALAEVAAVLPNGPAYFPDAVPDRYDLIRGAGLEDVKVGRLRL